MRTTRADNKVLQDLLYTFDAVGNITTWQDDAHQSVFFNNTEVEAKNEYVYDALYRLLNATGRELIGLNSAPTHAEIADKILPNDTTALRSYTQSYTYDHLGNLEEVHHNGGGGTANWSRYYHYAANNYLLSTSSDGTQPSVDQYTYDVHGSMLSMPHLSSMGWDFQNQLKEVDLGGGGTAYYVYSGGERVRKVVVKTGKVEDRKYLGGFEVYQEKASESATTIDHERETLHISDDMQTLALVDTLTIENGTAKANLAQEIRYQFSNHLGSAALELDGTAAVITYEEYFPFGNTSYRSGRSASEVSEKRYRYVFKELDNETGLYYYGMRYYAAWLHRFISVDPLQDKYPYYTPYQYAGNKPITFIDLDGAEPANPVGLMDASNVPPEGTKRSFFAGQSNGQTRNLRIRKSLAGNFVVGSRRSFEGRPFELNAINIQGVHPDIHMIFPDNSSYLLNSRPSAIGRWGNGDYQTRSPLSVPLSDFTSQERSFIYNYFGFSESDHPQKVRLSFSSSQMAQLVYNEMVPVYVTETTTKSITFSGEAFYGGHLNMSKDYPVPGTTNSINMDFIDDALEFMENNPDSWAVISVREGAEFPTLAHPFLDPVTSQTKYTPSVGGIEKSQFEVSQILRYMVGETVGVYFGRSTGAPDPDNARLERTKSGVSPNRLVDGGTFSGGGFGNSNTITVYFTTSTTRLVGYTSSSFTPFSDFVPNGTTTLPPFIQPLQ